MNAPLLGAALLALVCVLLLVRHDHPATPADPDDLSIGVRALLRGCQQRRLARAEEIRPLLGDTLIDALGGVAATRPCPATTAWPRRRRSAPVLSICVRRTWND